MMTSSERLLRTLDFQKMTDGGAVLETFFPWDQTVNRWVEEGLPSRFRASEIYKTPASPEQRYLDNGMAEPCHAYEQFLGFDGVKRMSFRLPYNTYPQEEHEPVIRTMEDWNELKAYMLKEQELYFTDENIERIYGRYKENHEKGDFSIRFRISGYFWTPRVLLGIAEHMMAFYDKPDLLHEINQYVTDMYIKYLDKIFDIIQPETILLEEDLSGANGPMLSPECFDEFVGAYYKQLFPFLKRKGVKNVFVDTDGDFTMLIPNFIEAGVDGFLPMDVNAGMDIVAVREQFPTLKFIGGFNKLEIAKGKEAIDAEFERLLPVIRQGGYVPGADHQVAPSTAFDDYRYYIMRLKEVMMQAGADI